MTLSPTRGMVTRAGALLVMCVSLGGAAARLSARRRDDRLATLRLLGATPAAVSALAVIESAVLAAAVGGSCVIATVLFSVASR